MLMRRNVAAGIGSNEQGEYCRAALQRSDRKEPRYKWPTLLLLLTVGCYVVYTDVYILTFFVWFFLCIYPNFFPAKIILLH